MTKRPGSITQSNSGSMSGGLQAAIGSNNSQVMNSTGSTKSNELSQAEAVEVLEQIKVLISNSVIPEVAKGKAATYVEAAKIEAEEANPDKQLISRNLERVTKNLEEVDKTVDAGKSILSKIIPLTLKLATWLGAAV
ncbi:hypothetical protein [Okeania sp. SIO2G5]|uniref:hypothetical protein n=1 Tax=Okeania sp. SIO2G5 TaxID=2607796 RepID=UPI0013C0220E|nr:hypothetical protein [Okeania sp. SIO2G5]NEP76453.1 hypothetical protein [Okeania sp. SIO2G5]